MILQQLLLQLILILLNAFFAATEIALLSVNEKKVRSLADEGDKKAKKLIITFSGGESNEDSSIIYKPEDCYESVVALERALLKEGRYEEAKEVYYIYLDKIKGIEYEEYYKGKVVGPLERYNLNKKNVNN